jgi:catechol 2,3-dioxygenase-like lactoylglutathione lyase family enzyme
MMIIGAHVVIYTKNPEADRAFFRDVLNFPSVDAGRGWLIFALPPCEAAFHDAENNGPHELYFMCDDIGATLGQLKANSVEVSEVQQQRWGKLATLTLPSGVKIGIYEPQHPSPLKLHRSGST